MASLSKSNAPAWFPESVGSTTGRVRVVTRSDLQLASLSSCGARDWLADRMKAMYSLELPAGPRLASNSSLTVLGTGPSSWLLLRTVGDNLATELAACLGEEAAICDQSDAYAIFRLQGSAVRSVLEKGLDLDLHETAFGLGDVAVTACSHIGVIVWQCDREPVYEVAVPRSYARDFCHWLMESAAEFGLRAITDTS